MSWEHLRTFEAVARLGSLTAASKVLGVSQSTVSRHLSRLEEGSASPLLLRESPVRLTARGSALLEAMAPMIDGALAAQSALEQTPELRGTVSLSTVGEVVRWALAGRLGSFYEGYPHLQLRILVDNQVASLAAGEADVALRLFRPERGELVVRKLRTEEYGLFGASSLALGPEVPWLGLTGSLAHIPEQRHAERAFGHRSARLLVEDLESLAIATEAGLGVAIMPRRAAARLRDVVEVCPQDAGVASWEPLPSRGLWMVVHRSKQRLPKVRALMQWLEDAIQPDPNVPASAANPSF